MPIFIVTVLVDADDGKAAVNKIPDDVGPVQSVIPKLNPSVQSGVIRGQAMGQPIIRKVETGESGSSGSEANS